MAGTCLTGERAMTKRWLIGTLTLSGLLWLTATTGLQGAKPSGALPLNVDFGSYRSLPCTSCPGGATTTGLYGDGLYIDGVDNVRAVLVTGNFVFDTNDNARLDLGRRLFLDFHGQSVPSPIPPSGAYAVDVFIGTIGVTGVAADDGDLRAMTAEQTLYRRARIGWTEGTKSYSLRWDNPVNNVDGLLSFHCDFGDPCQQWTMTPAPAPAPVDGQAGLYSISSGKKPTETYIGSYNMPFSAILTPK
jgi:hypothetical protein